MPDRPILEVIVCTVADAVAAERGGADRLEVISRFDLGGLTPDVSLVREIVETVSIPVRVMIRSQSDFAAAEGVEWEQLLDQARQIAALGVEGFVLGFLKGRKVDEGALATVLSCGPGVKATFHRAIEEVASLTDASRALKSHDQIDRILHSGGLGEPTARAERLAAIARLAGPEIRVIAGGGLDKRTIEIIRARTSINEFHVGRAARTAPEIDGAVDEKQVRELVALIRGRG
jgi:copper homeostasis protein